MLLTDKVRSYALAVCQSSENIFGPSFYDQHLKVVAEYAIRLAITTNADLEVVTSAAYLHDISICYDFGTLRDHAALSAAMANEYLTANDCPPQQRERIFQCILTHSHPLIPGDGSPEEVCLSNADALSQIVAPAYWLYFAYRVRSSSFEDGRRWLRASIEENWSEMIPAARELVEEEYQAARRLLAR